MRTALVLVSLALLAPLAPFADAHVESYSQSRALSAGPYLVFFEPRPQPPFANATASMVAQFSENDTGSLIRSVPATVLVGGPVGFAERKRMEPDGTGYHVASMVLPARGMYSARVVIRDDARGENFSVDTEFEVFPDIPYRIRPVDQALDVFIGQRTPLAFEIVDPLTLTSKDTLTDLSVRIEHWTDDHTTFLGADEVAAHRVTSGVWRVDHLFRETGMYHIRFASTTGGFNYADVPLLHVYAIEPPGASSVSKDTPGPAWGLVLVLVAAVALLRHRR